MPASCDYVATRIHRVALAVRRCRPIDDDGDGCGLKREKTGRIRCKGDAEVNAFIVKTAQVVVISGNVDAVALGITCESTRHSEARPISHCDGGRNLKVTVIAEGEGRVRQIHIDRTREDPDQRWIGREIRSEPDIGSNAYIETLK